MICSSSSSVSVPSRGTRSVRIVGVRVGSVVAGTCRYICRHRGAIAVAVQAVGLLLDQAGELEALMQVVLH